jgi:hypothetical protein
MKFRFLLALIPATLLLLPAASMAGTGILAVYSEPSGARVTIDGVDAGVTPYQNVEAPAGKHEVKAVLSNDYPPQVQEVTVEEQTPQVILFKFERSKGAFVGREIVRATKKYKGSVTFASVPAGAFVTINGESLKKSTPIGYTDVEVGRYSVEFQLDGKTLRSEFEVIQGETVKLVADFASGKVNNKWEEARLLLEAEKQEAAKREEAARAQQTQAQQAQEAKQPAPGPGETGVPQPVEGVPPYGELVITMNVRRDANLKYADYFDISFPRLPIESLSGPLFPAASAIGDSAFKDNFEYMNDALANTRQFTARLDFTVRDTALMEGRAKSGTLTVREGKYDLKVARRRLADRFFSVEKVAEINDQEPLEIVRGNRLSVQIDGHIDGENKFGYEIKRSYESVAKKKSSDKQAAAKESPKSEKGQADYTSLPIFRGGQD